jgi:hypothetical protein
MGHVKALEKTSCKYLIRRVEVKVDTGIHLWRWYFLRLHASFPYWHRVPYNCEYNLRFQSRVVTVWRESVVRPQALAGTITVVLYAEFDNVIEIGRNRQVLFDYIA